MTSEQARRALAALPTDGEQGIAAARKYWNDGSWASFLVSGYDFARLLGRAWEEGFWQAITALRVLDPGKAESDLALAQEKHRQRQLAEDEERRRKAEARKAKKRLNPQVKKNPLLPAAKVLPMVSSSRWSSRSSRTFRSSRTR